MPHVTSRSLDQTNRARVALTRVCASSLPGVLSITDFVAECEDCGSGEAASTPLLDLSNRRMVLNIIPGHRRPDLDFRSFGFSEFRIFGVLDFWISPHLTSPHLTSPHLIRTSVNCLLFIVYCLLLIGAWWRAPPQATRLKSSQDSEINVLADVAYVHSPSLDPERRGIALRSASSHVDTLACIPRKHF